VRAIVFGSLTGLAFGSGVASGQSGNFILGGIFGIFTITGIAQANKYSEARMNAILDDYAKGIGIPNDVRRKLKEKDFKE